MADSYPTSLFFLEDGETAILHYVALIKAHGWNSQSITLWDGLTGYQLAIVYHCKDTSSRNEHEFLIFEFVDEHKNKLVLRTDRHVGARKDTLSPSCTTSSAPAFRFSFPLPSVSENDSQTPSSSSHTCTSYPSDVCSDQHLAKDTIRTVRHPHHHEALKTITFKSDSSLCPSLWDVVILVQVTHDDSPFYNLLVRQCYWFADTIFCTLEKWANSQVVHDEKGKVKRERRQASIGCCRGVRVHSRNPEDIAKIRNKFEKEQKDMTPQKEDFERALTEEVEKTKRFAGHVEQLRSASAKAKGEQEERDTRLRNEAEETNRRNEEKIRGMEQEVARLQLELQLKDRKLQMHSNRKSKKRRFQ